MEIPLFQADEPLRFERVILYPYPDLKRIWSRVWITPVQGQAPNVELVVLNPDGTENTSVFMLAQAEQRAETTLHLREPVPGTTYRVVALLTMGLSENPELIEQHEFDLVLEFRNPEAGEAGFGFGVDWDEIGPKSSADRTEPDR